MHPIVFIRHIFFIITIPVYIQAIIFQSFVFASTQHIEPALMPALPSLIMSIIGFTIITNLWVFDLIRYGTHWGHFCFARKIWFELVVLKALFVMNMGSLIMNMTQGTGRGCLTAARPAGVPPDTCTTLVFMWAGQIIICAFIAAYLVFLVIVTWHHCEDTFMVFHAGVRDFPWRTNYFRSKKTRTQTPTDKVVALIEMQDFSKKEPDLEENKLPTYEETLKQTPSEEWDQQTVIDNEKEKSLKGSSEKGTIDMGKKTGMETYKSNV
ncbi:hypothetical protein M422DRAFT_774364 [Sphaerobolus stellatus SS14]|nr:hypothetical protein M422DRAFT_774364 [Sphaerobolus stellatus SS14]